MFDVSSRVTFKNVKNWLNDIKQIAGQVPIVVTGNKVDLGERKVKTLEVMQSLKKRGVHYVKISVKLGIK